MDWEERLLKLPGGGSALTEALTFLSPFEPDAPEDAECNEDCSRAYALERLDAITGNYLWGLEEVEIAPTIAQTRTYLRKIERQARELEMTLAQMTQWTIRPMFDVLDERVPYDSDSLFISASGNDLPLPWSFDVQGCPGWQSKLDGLSRWAGKASEHLEGISKGGPINMAKLENGNPKVGLVLDCEKTLSEFRKNFGLSKDGPLIRFVRVVHRLATGNEGNGWEDAIKEVGEWRKSFSNPFWNEWWAIWNEETLLKHRLGLHPAAPLPDIPETTALRKRFECLQNAEQGMTKGPHKLKEYRKANGGANPEIPGEVSPVEPNI